MKTLFQPDSFTAPKTPASAAAFGERGEGRVYVYDDRTVFAVQAAQVTGRPLLLRGPAGSGKSSLAPFVAHTLAYRFYMFTVTARTQARDLMWEFDALGRLNDANISSVDAAAQKRVGNLYNYIVPGKLWWAFDRATALRRGAPDSVALDVKDASDPDSPTSADPSGNDTPDPVPAPGTVLLIDEIDKADPDVPNNLLEALGSRHFTVQETGTQVRDQQRPLVMITTNDERELPQAFQRRCITLHLKEKTPAELSDIARQHFGRSEILAAFLKKHYQGDAAPFFDKVAGTLEKLREEATARGDRRPSTAEFLDTLAACIALDVKPTDPPVAAPGQAAAPAESTEARRWRHAIEVALSKRSANR